MEYEGAVAPRGFSRTTLSLPGRKNAIILGMVVLAFVILISIFFSYQVIFFYYSVFTILVMAYYLMLWLDGRGMPRARQDWKAWPPVSIVIPSYNSHHTIFRCLEACKSMEYPGNMEIIVVDDGSTDGSAAKLEKIEGILLLKKQKNEGKGAAINLGICRSSGEVVACLDSDTYPEKDALTKSVCYLQEDQKAGAVVLYINTTEPKNLLQGVQEMEYWVAYGLFFKTLDWIDSVFVTPGPMAVYRRKIFDQIGYFDEKNLAEDMEIALRMHRHGWKIRACVEAKVKTEVPNTIRSFYRQRLRWYRGGLVNLLKYPDLILNPSHGSFGMLILPIVLLSGLFSALFLSWSVLNTFRSLGNTLLPYLFNFWELVPSGVRISLDFFLLDSALVFGLIPLMIWAYFLYTGFRLSGNRPQAKHILPAALLFTLYPLAVGLTFLSVYIKELSGQEYKW